MQNMFVLEDFKIPKELKEKDFFLKPLTTKEAENDYKAIIENIDYLRKLNPLGNNWPPKDLTFDEDLQSIKIHENEFKKREAFTYTILNPEKTKCLGCLYIYPSHLKEYNAIVFFWTINKELDKKFFPKIKKWLKEKWNFRKITYLGRKIS